MRLTRNHLDYMAFLVLKALKANPGVTVLDADQVVAVIRREITGNLRAEEEIEREAIATLAPHRQRILSEGADYQKLIRDGKRALARKRGIVV
ncbi:DUF507 family protein [Candidatus Poribacteria bacterium]|nr:DUF507 family protein [Candidatus Poribacteria bacterium]